MKRILTLIASTVSLLLVAMLASATQFPPGPDGPGGACEDSVVIRQIQDTTFTCAAASGDTLAGVTGTVTAFDKDFSPFAFWIQTSTAGPWQGVQVFTGSFNYFSTVTPESPGLSNGGLVLGSQVRVSGRKLEFTGPFTELTDYDNGQGTNDIVIFETGTAAVPGYYVGDVDQFNWVPALATNGEPYEGMLVKLRGPLVVGRIAGLGVGSRTMLVSHASFPGDTAALDGFSLSNIPALAVGTVIDSAQGVMHQAVISGVSSYRILMRGSEDLFASAPPTLVDAYPIEDNIIRLQFDRDLNQASADSVQKYSLASFGTINSATLEGGSGKFVQLNVSNGLFDGDAETVTASDIRSAAGLKMPAPQSRSFANGVMSLRTLQLPDAAGLGGAPCADRSRFALATGGSGTRISYRGTVVAAFGTVYYLADEDNVNLRSAMPVFAPPSPLTVGRRYLIAGQLQEFNGISTSVPGGLTEGVTTVYLKDEGVGVIPTPRTQTIAVLSDTTCDVAQSLTNGEDYEGMLVRVQYARITEDRLPGEGFFIAGPAPGFADTMLVSNQSSSYAFDPDSAHTVTVTGLLNYREGTRPFRISPRNDADIADHGLNVGVGAGEVQQLRFAVGPNPSRNPRLTFALPKGTNVDIGVFDVSGRRVGEIFKGYLPAGTYQRDWNRSGKNALGAGMYFLRLKTDDASQIARAVLLQ
ncbi:MAG: T9SS type A sorting domain-containing protein [Candidatus Eisenbacteria bacterium]|uniref:T9SS type A sorting domain-containing protein n=1 Tax=Eiseniibacteriota bacterium TaxID=2212470 RepID=A0A849SR03_UNCEI|nr:T9SS type A sorting domain-containing protein [Candidatus Eisenbacteria bacterium]